VQCYLLRLHTPRSWSSGLWHLEDGGNTVLRKVGIPPIVSFLVVQAFVLQEVNSQEYLISSNLLTWFNQFCLYCASFFSIALGYRLDDRGFRVRFPAGAGHFSLHHRVQTGSGSHSASYPMVNRGSFRENKAAGAWNWPLHLLSRSKMRGAIPPVPQYAFMAWWWIKKGTGTTLPSPFYFSH
jgi:hypothetical protein